MSDLSHVDISQPFNGRDGDDFDPGIPQVAKRKPERVGKPRAARESDLEARLYALNRRVIVDWQEGR